LDEWLLEAKRAEKASDCGMYLFHDGVVRITPKAKVRSGEQTNKTVKAVQFSCDAEKTAEAVNRVMKMPGIFYARVWLNEGTLSVGEDLMLVLVGGDIRPHVVDALQSLVSEIKNSCVTEQEIFGE
jgi:molybdopterin synthase catalytic subunit